MSLKLYPILTEMTSGQTARQMGVVLGLHDAAAKTVIEQAVAVGLGGLVYQVGSDASCDEFLDVLDHQDVSILEDLSWLSKRDLAERWIAAGQHNLTMLWGDRLSEVMQGACPTPACDPEAAADLRRLTAALVLAVVSRQLRTLGFKGDAAREFLLIQRPDVLEAAPSLQPLLVWSSSSAARVSQLQGESRIPTLSVGAASAAQLRGQSLDDPGHYGEGDITERLVAMAQDAARAKLGFTLRGVGVVAAVAVVGAALWWGVPYVLYVIDQPPATVAPEANAPSARDRSSSESIPKAKTGPIETATPSQATGNHDGDRASAMGVRPAASPLATSSGSEPLDWPDLISRARDLLEGVHDEGSARNAAVGLDEICRRVEEHVHEAGRMASSDRELLAAQVGSFRRTMRESLPRISQIPSAAAVLRPTLARLAAALNQVASARP